MYTAIVTVPSVFLYESPSAENVSDELLSGWLVTVQNRQGNFLEITTDYGYTGWLECPAVRRLSSEEALNLKVSAKTPEDTERPAVLCRGITDIQKKPRVQSASISALFMGSHVSALGRPRDGWQKIKTAEGICGYVPAVSLVFSDNNSFICGNAADAYGLSLFHSDRHCQTCASHSRLHSDRRCQTCAFHSRLRQNVLHYAKSYLGVQYRWGGKTHAGIDCSGLAFMSYYMCGIIIYRDAVMMEGYPVREIPFSCIHPADLIYFPGHVALYLGNGDYIHSTGNMSVSCCTINSLNPYSPIYRKDLAESITAVGSVFCAS